MHLSAEHLDCSLRPSRIHGRLIFGLHLLCGVVLTGLALSPDAMLTQAGPPYLPMALLLAVACSYLHYRNYASRVAPAPVVRLLCSGQEWRVITSGGELIVVRPVGDIVVFRFLVVITLQDARGRKYPVPVLPDSTSAREFRRLKVFLGFAGTLGAAR
jgi:hypothetical protein